MTRPILFDIDGTLVNTNMLKLQTSSALAGLLKLSSTTMSQVVDDYVHSLPHPHDFHPRKLAEFLASRYATEAEIIYSTYCDYITPELLYADVLPALSGLASQYPLGVFSEGFTDFQTMKLERSGLLRLLDPHHLYIFPRKLEINLPSILPENALIVDDTDEALTVVRGTGFLGIRLDRDQSSLPDQIPTIATLTGLSPLLSSLQQ